MGVGVRDKTKRGGGRRGPQNSAEVERFAEPPDQYLQEHQIYSSTSPPWPSKGTAACLLKEGSEAGEEKKGER